MNRMEELVFLDRAYQRLPEDVFRYMLRFIPPKRPPPPPKHPAGVQRQVEVLSRSPKLTAMAFYGLQDFLLEQ
jgi:hypothetical protein